MPRAMRPHMHAIYAYARMADDFADEEHDPGQARRMGARAGPRLRRRAAPSGVRRAGRHRAPLRHSARAVRRSAARVSLRPRISRLRDPRRSARATRATRPIRSAAWCSICSAIATRSASVSPIWCAADFSSRISGRTSRSISTKGRIYFPRGTCALRRDASRTCALHSATPDFVALMRHEVACARELLVAGAALASMVDRRLCARHFDVRRAAGSRFCVRSSASDYDVFIAARSSARSDYLRAGMAGAARAA